MDLCILSDFDGTITEKDTLYNFFSEFCPPQWQEVESLWAEGIIGSKECLLREFALVPDLSKSFIDDYIMTVKIDPYFSDFLHKVVDNGIDFCIVSDGVDYFIQKILENYGLRDVKIFANHGFFDNNTLKLSFPNVNSGCVNNAGTCKCKILDNFKKKYINITYIGDGVSDYCVADKADKLFAKAKLAQYCEDKSINYTSYSSFEDIINSNILV